MKRLDKTKLEPGMWVMERSHSAIGWLIRSVMCTWENRVCAKLGVRPAPVWHNHDKIVVMDERTGELGFGEALGGGNAITSLELTEQDLNHGDYELRFFRVIGCTFAQKQQAAHNWSVTVFGKPYDFWALPRLLVDAFCGRIFKSCGEPDHFYCTEGVAEAYWPTQELIARWHTVKPVADVIQDWPPTPMHAEQVAGLIPKLPRKQIRLEEVHGVIVEC